MGNPGPQSPKGRWIDEVDGDAEHIVTRGNEIEKLGRAMISSATMLEQVKNGADGQKGLAVDKLREVVGETYGLLRQGGELYKPTGPVLVAYGEALGDVQPKLKGHVDACTALWSTFQSLPGSVEPRGTGGWFEPEDDSPEALEQKEEDDAKLAAYNAWEAEAGYWDAEYDTWEDAFDQAVSGIGDVLKGKVEDGFWDNVDGFVAGLQTALSWAGLVVGILALILGGPLLALIAAVIGLVALGLTIYQKVRGDAGWLQLGLAVLAVVPFGKLGKVAQGKFSFADDLPWGSTAWSKAAGQFDELSAAFRGANGGGRGALAVLRSAYASGNAAGAGDIMLRLITGKDTTGIQRMSDGIATVGDGLTGALDIMHGLMGVPLKYDGWISLFSGHETIKKQMPIFDVFW